MHTTSSPSAAAFAELSEVEQRLAVTAKFFHGLADLTRLQIVEVRWTRGRRTSLSS